MDNTRLPRRLIRRIFLPNVIREEGDSTGASLALTFSIQATDYLPWNSDMRCANYSHQCAVGAMSKLLVCLLKRIQR